MKHASKGIISSHYINFGLDKPLSYKSLVFPQICNGCKASFKLLSGIDSHIPAEDGFKTLFEDLSLDFYLYMVHKIRVMNQNTYIKDLMEKLEDDSYVCIVVMDFKMKF